MDAPRPVPRLRDRLDGRAKSPNRAAASDGPTPATVDAVNPRTTPHGEVTPPPLLPSGRRRRDGPLRPAGHVGRRLLGPPGPAMKAIAPSSPEARARRVRRPGGKRCSCWRSSPRCHRPPRAPAPHPCTLYLDCEMTPDDLRERLGDMGYGPGDDLEPLAYYSLPSLPPLDTPEGGAVTELAREHGHLVVSHAARVIGAPRTGRHDPSALPVHRGPAESRRHRHASHRPRRQGRRARRARIVRQA